MESAKVAGLNFGPYIVVPSVDRDMEASEATTTAPTYNLSVVAPFRGYLLGSLI